MTIGNRAIQESFCDEFGFTPVGQSLQLYNKTYSVAKVALNKVPHKIIKMLKN